MEIHFENILSLDSSLILQGKWAFVWKFKMFILALLQMCVLLKNNNQTSTVILYTTTEAKGFIEPCMLP